RTVHSNARQPFGQGLLTRPGWGTRGDLTPISGPAGRFTAAPQKDATNARPNLLDLGGAARLLDLLQQALGLLALDRLLDRLGRLVDESLRLLEAEPGGRSNNLDHADLLVAGAGQHEVDGPGLLLGRYIAGGRAGCGRRGGDRGRGDAELLLERLDALG